MACDLVGWKDILVLLKYTDKFKACRRMFQTAIVVFLVGSLMCGLAPTMLFLIAGSALLLFSARSRLTQGSR